MTDLEVMKAMLDRAGLKYEAIVRDAKDRTVVCCEDGTAGYHGFAAILEFRTSDGALVDTGGTE